MSEAVPQSDTGGSGFYLTVNGQIESADVRADASVVTCMSISAIPGPFLAEF